MLEVRTSCVQALNNCLLLLQLAQGIVAADIFEPEVKAVPLVAQQALA
jgi:hypothetical protein